MPFHLRGTLTVPEEKRHEVREALGEHVRLTREEPGCLSFEVAEAEPGVFEVAESFRDAAAFEAHQKRMFHSDWAVRTEGMARNYETWSD